MLSIAVVVMPSARLQIPRCLYASAIEIIGIATPRPVFSFGSDGVTHRPRTQRAAVKTVFFLANTPTTAPAVGSHTLQHDQASSKSA